MEPKIATNAPPSCPSAQPDMDDSITFGIVRGTVEQPLLAYLDELQPVTDELLALTQPVKPTEVFRFAAPCATTGCQHFDGTNCRLAMRIVEKLPAVTDELPPCRLRPNCRWWQQEGKAACMRCPQVVTDLYHPSELQLEVAAPVKA